MLKALEGSAHSGPSYWNEEPKDELESNLLLDPGHDQRIVSAGVIASHTDLRLAQCATKGGIIS